MIKFTDRYVTHTREEAKAEGYVSITVPFGPTERDIFDKALDTLSTTDYMIVSVEGGYLEFWRKKSQLKDWKV